MTSAQSQSDGRHDVLNDCVKIVQRTWTQILTKKGGILSGPVDLLVSSDSSSSCIPSHIMESRDGRARAIWHDRCNGVPFCEDRGELCRVGVLFATRVSQWSVNAAILAVSCLRALKDLEECLGLFLTLPVR